MLLVVVWLTGTTEWPFNYGRLLWLLICLHEAYLFSNLILMIKKHRKQAYLGPNLQNIFSIDFRYVRI